jgi:2',3'-cyclic-nucleotide 2'-phosphodiesterase
LRILAIGDVIGKPGRDAMRRHLPPLVAGEKIDLVVANAENSAGGLGTTPETADDLFAAGATILTGGNHTWKHRELYGYLDKKQEILRPYNYPAGAPGRGAAVFALPDGRRYGVINLIGRVYMEPTDDPFAAANAALAGFAVLGDEAPKVILVDMHGEATSEKRAMGMHLAGRVSAVWGTHTHVPTADEEVLPEGTAYVTDLGMTGPYRSVIGLDPGHAVRKFVTARPSAYRLAEGDVQLRAALIDVDDASGRATAIRRVTARG